MESRDAKQEGKRRENDKIIATREGSEEGGNGRKEIQEARQGTRE